MAEHAAGAGPGPAGAPAAGAGGHGADRRFLCSGPTWRSGRPVLALHTPDGRPAPLPLAPESALGWRVLAEDTRWCLGWWSVTDADHRRHHPCPAQRPAAGGYACAECAGRDEVRPQHDSHRSGRMGAGLRRYLAQPHWLYVATFAGGMTKIGTASDTSRHHRLVEQGALHARYVARADDGLVVRVLEDAVSAALGLPQAVRSAVKTAALAALLSPAGLPGAAGRGGPAAADDGLARINALAAEQVRSVLADVAVDGFAVVDRRWERPQAFAQFLARLPAPAYPLNPAAGEHGVQVLAVLGPTLLAAVPPTGERFVMDLARLKGRRLQLGRFSAALPARQPTLFEAPGL